MKRAILECWTGLMFCWIGLIFCFIMTYLFGSVLKDSIQMLSKLFIFFCVLHTFFFLVFHTTDNYYLISILFIFILLVLRLSGFSSSDCGFVNLFMIKFKLKVIQ